MHWYFVGHAIQRPSSTTEVTVVMVDVCILEIVGEMVSEHQLILCTSVLFTLDVLRQWHHKFNIYFPWVVVPFSWAQHSQHLLNCEKGVSKHSSCGEGPTVLRHQKLPKWGLWQRKKYFQSSQQLCQVFQIFFNSLSNLRILKISISQILSLVFEWCANI